MKYTLTTLCVSDLDQSLAFYRDGLGLPLIERFSNGKGDEIAMLGEAEHAHLELIRHTDGGAPIPSPAMSIGFETHRARQLAEALDPAYEGPVSPNPALCFYFLHDPDGYRIQLIERKSR